MAHKWNRVMHHRIVYVGVDSVSVNVLVMCEDGSTRVQEFRYDWSERKWWHAKSGQDTESASKFFFDSDLARDVLSSSREGLKQRFLENLRAKFEEIVRDASRRGVDRDELVAVLDETIARSVMES